VKILLYVTLCRWGWVISVMPGPCFTLWKRTPVPIGQESGWVSELVWTQRLEEKEKVLASAVDRTPVIQSVVRQFTEISCEIASRTLEQRALWWKCCASAKILPTLLCSWCSCKELCNEYGMKIWRNWLCAWSSQRCCLLDVSKLSSLSNETMQHVEEAGQRSPR
jgi:hypothetical protein